ncbi:hypothetical protein J2754_002930 [Halarchaeum solikamskense]|nr:hypothetical protein [Halarchaeum solikamskense]
MAAYFVTDSRHQGCNLNWLDTTAMGLHLALAREPH